MQRTRKRTTLIVAIGLVAALLVDVVIIASAGNGDGESVAELLSLGNRFLGELNYEQALVMFMRVIEMTGDADLQALRDELLGVGLEAEQVVESTPEMNLEMQFLGEAVTIAAGHGSSFAIQSDRSLWVWGINGGGQLGNGTITDWRNPRP